MPASSPIVVYCDMVTDGGGWTLALFNSKYSSSPTPTWLEAINNSNNITGSFSDNIDTDFDLLLGLKYWNKLGLTLRIETGDDSKTIVHRADYPFSLIDSGTDPDYTIEMGEEQIISDDKTPSGLYLYNRNLPFSTKDRDNDTNPGNCSANYGNTAWWYGGGDCWRGSFWGYAAPNNKPYWSYTNTDSYDWGAFWIR